MSSDEKSLFRRIHALAVGHFDASLSDSEHAELEELLLENPKARQLYVKYFQETAGLRWLCLEEIASGNDSHLPAEGEPSKVISGARPYRRPLQVFLGAVACSILLMVFARWQNQDASTAETGNEDFAKTAKSAEVGVATVTRLDEARWAFEAESARLLTRCEVGQSWQLLEGCAELYFDAGALVTIFAPADFDILSSTSIRCRRGRVTALVDERGKGFTVETPQGTVVDLGTQFGLDISDDGETKVVVFQGSIDLTPPTGGESRRLEQGDALLLKKSGQIQRLVAFRRNTYFLRERGDLNPAPLIANVSDNIRKEQSAKSYQIVHAGLGEDVPCFVDRSHQWNGVEPTGMPEFLLGADYIMPFNDDKFVGELELTIELARPAVVYVFLDNNMKVPEWLRTNFEDTKLDIGLDGSKTKWHPANSLDTGAGNSVDFTFSIWRRLVPEPGVVKLGGLTPPRIGTRKFGFNMYGIAAVELQQAGP